MKAPTQWWETQTKSQNGRIIDDSLFQFPCPDGSTGAPCTRNDQDANVLYDNKMLGVPRFQPQQDHQRWGYSTVTHLEQFVHLATWKDLNREKKKNTEKRLNHGNGEDGRAFPFFSASVCAFGAHFRRYWTISDYHGPFETILDHIGSSWTILDYNTISWPF